MKVTRFCLKRNNWILSKKLLGLVVFTMIFLNITWLNYYGGGENVVTKTIDSSEDNIPRNRILTLASLTEYYKKLLQKQSVNRKIIRLAKKDNLGKIFNESNSNDNREKVVAVEKIPLPKLSSTKITPNKAGITTKDDNLKLFNRLLSYFGKGLVRGYC